MLDGDAVQEIKKLAQEALTPSYRIHEIDGVPWTITHSGQPVEIVAEDHFSERLDVHTLDGFCDYVTTNPEILDPKKYVIHIVDPGGVRVVSIGLGHRQRRHIPIAAFAPAAENPFHGGRPQNRVVVDPESAIVALKALYHPTEDRDAILAMLSALSHEDTVETTDDGVAQKVAVMKGVRTREQELTKGLYMLAPMRSFIEISTELDASEYVMRLEKMHGGGVGVSLTAADGGLWKLDAIDAIHRYIASGVGDTWTIIR